MVEAGEGSIVAAVVTVGTAVDVAEDVAECPLDPVETKSLKYVFSEASDYGRQYVCLHPSTSRKRLIVHHVMAALRRFLASFKRGYHSGLWELHCIASH